MIRRRSRTGERKYSVRVRSWHRRVPGIEKDSSILFRFCTLPVAGSYSHKMRRHLTADRSTEALYDTMRGKQKQK